MEKPFIPIILGTNRKGRQSEKVANFLLTEMKKRDDLETELIDLRDLHFPYDDYGPDIAPQFPVFMEAMRRANGAVIVTPEYNNSYPGILKTALDLLELSDVGRKPVGLASVSNGAFGGVRCITALLPVLRTIGFVTIRAQLTFPMIEESFDGEKPKDEKYDDRVKKFLDELILFANKLK